MLVGDKIKKLRKEKRMTQKELALKLGLAPTAISAWERNANKPMMDSLSMMANLFNVPITYFYEEGGNLTWKISEEQELYKTNTEFSYPYIRTPISAGLPETVEGVTQMNNMTIPDIIMGKYAGNKCIQMMRVNGESMNRIIPHGSLIAVKKVELSNLKNGDVVVYGDDHSYSVKRFYRLDDKLVFRPDSNDERFTDYVTTADELVEIVGKVVVYVVELD